MTAMTVINLGPWRIRTSAVKGKAAITYSADSASEVIASETLPDLALLRDAITEYLDAVEANR